MKTPASKLHEDLMNKLVILHIYKQEHEDDPVAGLHALLKMEQEIVLDPAVSEKAAALVQSGREQADKEQYTQGYQDGLKNRSSAVNLSILLDKVDALHDHLFSICCSNPIYNAWGQPVDVSPLNDIHEFSRGIRPHMERPNLTAPAHFYKLRQELKGIQAKVDQLEQDKRDLESELHVANRKLREGEALFQQIHEIADKMTKAVSHV